MEYEIKIVDGLVLADPQGVGQPIPSPEDALKDVARQIELLNELLRELEK